MTIDLLPSSFDELVRAAVLAFWTARGSVVDAGQDGNRGAVIGGKNLDGFLEVVKAVTVHCGLPASAVKVDGRAHLTVPGFFRATKNWDAVVIHRQRLIAAFEFKSQVGPSFGNNFNNRAEEVLGNAVDLWEAHRNGAFSPENYAGPELFAMDSTATTVDPRPPFVGWLMLLEDCAESTSARQERSKHFKVFPEFQSAPYAVRYRLLCERLMMKGLYSGAALMLSTREGGAELGSHRALGEPTSVRAMFSQYAGYAAAAAESW